MNLAKRLHFFNLNLHMETYLEAICIFHLDKVFKGSGILDDIQPFEEGCHVLDTSIP